MSNSTDLLKTTSEVLVFGAHPDDIEFACGGVIALETAAGKRVHFVVSSHGEAASNGTSSQREEEARKAAEILGATIEFIDLEGDSHLSPRVEHAIKLAALIRKFKPLTVLAPSTVPNQHPDHARLGELVRDAARLARYGGLSELREMNAHSIEALFFYAVTPDGEPRDATPILIDVSRPAIVDRWTVAMQAHASQAATRNYVDLQLNRARVLGARAGVEYATALFANDPLVFTSLSAAGRGARKF